MPRRIISSPPPSGRSLPPCDDLLNHRRPEGERSARQIAARQNLESPTCHHAPMTTAFATMRPLLDLIRFRVLTLLVLLSFAAVSTAQDVTIPDPGLQSAIRDALQKPVGPLTEQDLLNLTQLS